MRWELFHVKRYRGVPDTMRDEGALRPVVTISLPGGPHQARHPAMGWRAFLWLSSKQAFMGLLIADKTPPPKHQGTGPYHESIGGHFAIGTEPKQPGDQGQTTSGKGP